MEAGREEIGALRFVLSDSVADEVTAAFRKHARRIRELLPDVEIQHTGGTSVSGLLTTGDVDLHVRTTKEAFKRARDVLGRLYQAHYTDAWHAEGAFFKAPGATPPVEVALTAIGSLDDVHHGRAWDRIAADPELIERYNAIKRRHEGGSIDAYNAAKREFFYRNFGPERLSGRSEATRLPS